MKTITIKKYLDSFIEYDETLKYYIDLYGIGDIEFLDFVSFFGIDERLDNPANLKDFIKDPLNGYFIEEFKEYYNDKINKTK